MKTMIRYNLKTGQYWLSDPNDPINPGDKDSGYAMGVEDCGYNKNHSPHPWMKYPGEDWFCEGILPRGKEE